MQKTNEELLQIINSLLNWAWEVNGDQGVKDALNATDLSPKEAVELGVIDSDMLTDEDDLPTEARMDVDSCLADNIEDDEYIKECIEDYLADTYGYTVFSYSYEIIGDEILISDIEWDVD